MLNNCKDCADNACDHQSIDQAAEHCIDFVPNELAVQREKRRLRIADEYKIRLYKRDRIEHRPYNAVQYRIRGLDVDSKFYYGGSFECSLRYDTLNDVMNHYGE